MLILHIYSLLILLIICSIAAFFFPSSPPPHKSIYMASTKLNFTFLFISLIILCHVIDSALSRPLKMDTNNDQFHGQSVEEEGKGTNEAVSTPNPPTAAASTPGRKVDDFRPTTPGHSPGVGHSIQN